MQTMVQENVKRNGGYPPEDKFGLLVARGGGIPVVEYLKLPSDTKRKVLKLHKGLKLLPDKCLTREVQYLIVNEIGMTDYQRFLFMLFQGGYLSREKDSVNRVVHVKTDLARTLTDEQLAADIMSKNRIMTGFPIVNRKKRTAKRKDAKQEKETVGERLEKESTDPISAEVPGQSAFAIADRKEINLEPGSDPEETLASLLQGLDKADTLMVQDIIRTLKVTRLHLPKLKRKEFLATFANGSRFVEE